MERPQHELEIEVKEGGERRYRAIFRGASLVSVGRAERCLMQLQEPTLPPAWDLIVHSVRGPVLRLPRGSKIRYVSDGLTLDDDQVRRGPGDTVGDHCELGLSPGSVSTVVLGGAAFIIGLHSPRAGDEKYLKVTGDRPVCAHCQAPVEHPVFGGGALTPCDRCGGLSRLDREGAMDLEPTAAVFPAIDVEAALQQRNQPGPSPDPREMAATVPATAPVRIAPSSLGRSAPSPTIGLGRRRHASPSPKRPEEAETLQVAPVRVGGGAVDLPEPQGLTAAPSQLAADGEIPPAHSTTEVTSHEVWSMLSAEQRALHAQDQSAPPVHTLDVPPVPDPDVEPPPPPTAAPTPAPKPTPEPEPPPSQATSSFGFGGTDRSLQPVDQDDRPDAADTLHPAPPQEPPSAPPSQHHTHAPDVGDEGRLLEVLGVIAGLLGIGLMIWSFFLRS